MQGKGLIKFFLIALTVVCLWQYLYILPTNKVERAADSFAAAAAANAAEVDKYSVEKAARTAFLDSMSSETIFSIPLLKKFTYQELKSKQLNLGLDLKGGMSVVLQVDLKDFLKSMSADNKDPDFLKALENASERQKTAQSDYVNLFADEFKKIGNGKTLASIFSRNESLKDKINFETSNSAVLAVIRQKANETVDLTFKRLKDRIDQFGVTQPNVSLDAARDLIIVELPGVDNPERARRLLQAAAKLEFWDVYRTTDAGINNAFVEADARLKRMAAGDTATVAVVDSVFELKRDSLGNVVDSFKVAKKDDMGGGGPLLSLLSLNAGSADQLIAAQSVLGIADKNKMKAISEYLKREDVKNLFPRDLEFRWASKPMKGAKGVTSTNYELYGIRKVRGKDEAPLEGDHVINATSNPDPRSGEVQVSLKMDNRGAKIWADMTTKAANDGNREIAIVLDDQVMSAPRVINPITGGDSQITGDFTIQEGRDLANILQIGKLPAKTSIIQEALVGPSLGKENISKSLLSMILGFLVIMGIMIAYYTSAGVISVVALIANVFFIMGVLTSMGTVLTLPGIAGLLLTMAMAVDADVIIYERIREELRAGKAMAVAVKDGFKGSYSAIIDGNVSNLLVALVLAYYGLGPIKGFAVVLIIGIIASLFTAVLVCQLMIDYWLNKGKTLKFSTRWSDGIFSGINVDWVGKRRIAYAVSSVIILAGIGSYFTRGFELGVDFKGGYSYNVQFEPGKNVGGDEIRNALTTAFSGTPVVKAVDTKNTFNITTSYLVNESNDDTDSKVMAKLHEGLNSVLGGTLVLEEFKKSDGRGTHIISSTKVGPTVADDIKSSAFKSMALALLLVFIYILIRFSKWQYSLGAVISLFHDVLIVLAIYSMLHGILPFSMEIDQAMIAALLTVVGYSLNDTVIVFDRIREFIGLNAGKPKKIVINDAINNTLNRTVMTSFITLVTLAILFIFGGSAIKGFTFALFIGIFAGTYSSIFIATPIVVDLTGGDENSPIEPLKKIETVTTKSATEIAA